MGGIIKYFKEYFVFLVLKKKWVVAILCAIVLICGIGAFYSVRAATAQPRFQKVVVLDAGHGGKDGGAVGKLTDESQLNLKYCLVLKEKFEQFGFKVVLTRKNMEGLYSPFATNKKKSEMEKRKQIIESANPDLVISVHMNSFPSSKARGAQVFYGQGNESGQALAQSVGQTLSAEIEYAKQTAKVGDYFVLNCTNYPSILVECGFISNPDEELLLTSEDYQNKFCYALVCGVLKYFKF